MLEGSDEVELPEAEGKRLVVAGVLEEAGKSKGRHPRTSRGVWGWRAPLIPPLRATLHLEVKAPA